MRGMIAERNILSPLCLFAKAASINLALASLTGNKFLTQKSHIQSAKQLSIATVPD
jgi:hypothetical protein